VCTPTRPVSLLGGLEALCRQAPFPYAVVDYPMYTGAVSLCGGVVTLSRQAPFPYAVVDYSMYASAV
jgi:hypothetical protein